MNRHRKEHVSQLRSRRSPALCDDGTIVSTQARTMDDCSPFTIFEFRVIMRPGVEVAAIVFDIESQEEVRDRHDNRYCVAYSM